MPENQIKSRERVMRAARGALERAAGGGSAVPEQLPAAVVEGRGDRGAVQAATRRMFGERRPLDLVIFDTDRIGAYVFESSRPPVLAGGSKILSLLNQEIETSPDYQEAVVFSGGGEGMLLVPAGDGERVCRDIEARFRTASGGALQVTTGWLNVAPHDFIPVAGGSGGARDGAVLVSGTRAVLAELRDRIRQEKDRRLPSRERVPGGTARCVSCRDRAAGSRKISDFRPNPKADGPLCDPCALRWEKGQGQISGISFDEVVERAFPRESARGARTGYLGFLYVDGNGMGALFGDLRSLAELRFASLAVRQIFARVHDRVRAAVRETFCEIDETDLPIVSLLGGGDEVIWILPGALAVDAADRLSGWIADEEEAIGGADLRSLLQRAGRQRITFGAGLALCGLGYPVRYQYELAKALLKNAKSVFYARKDAEQHSSLDFEVLTESSPLSEDLKSARVLTFGTEESGFFRSCRPYRMDDFHRLLESLRTARTHKLAKSQLYSLQAGAGETRSVFLNFLRYQIAREPAGTRYQKWLQTQGVAPWDRQALESFFVRDVPGTRDGTRGTWITDALHLAPFLELIEKKKEKGRA